MELKYHTKKIAFFAIQWTGENIAEVMAFVDYKKALLGLDNKLIVETSEGFPIANIGDYIIKDAKDNLYLSNPSIFEATYEKVR